MPDFASQLEDSIFDGNAFTGGAYDDAPEPNEEDLIAALRNQDDIPILMDIVADQVSAAVSQETQLSDAMENVSVAADSTAIEDDVVAVRDQAPETNENALVANLPATQAEEADILLADQQTESQQAPAVTQEQIAQAVSQVLEKRLPELVQEVLNAIDGLPTQAK